MRLLPSLYIALLLIPAWGFLYHHWPIWGVCLFAVAWGIVGVVGVRWICTPPPSVELTYDVLDGPVTRIMRPIHVYEEEPTIPLLNAPEE